MSKVIKNQFGKECMSSSELVYFTHRLFPSCSYSNPELGKSQCDNKGMLLRQKITCKRSSHVVWGRGKIKLNIQSSISSSSNLHKSIFHLLLPGKKWFFCKITRYTWNYCAKCTSVSSLTRHCKNVLVSWSWKHEKRCIIVQEICSWLVHTWINVAWRNPSMIMIVIIIIIIISLKWVRARPRLGRLVASESRKK